MSRGQKRRVPANFPRMKYRALKRKFRTIHRAYGIVLVRDLVLSGDWVSIDAFRWEVRGPLLNASTWLDGVE